MQLRRFVVLLCCLGAWALAQAPSLSGRLADVRVEGTTDYATVVKTIIRSRPGTPVDQIDLESERNLVLSRGVFAEVTVRLEEQPSGPVLVIRVRENPKIAEVKVEGSSLPINWLQGLARSGIEAGVTFSTTASEEVIPAIKQAYKQQGFPFEVPVTLEVSSVVPDPNTETTATEVAPVQLVYTISESAPLRELQFEGASVLNEEELTQVFRALKDTKIFNYQTYSTALAEIAMRYRTLGFRGSGVDTEASALIDGLLTVRFKELKVISLDTTAIGVDPSTFSLKPGDLYNYDVLLADIKRLSKGRDSDISFQPLQLSTGDVRISFLAGPPGEAGAISDIAIEGNTVISTEAILAVLELSPGDNFTSVLANEDFARISQLYTDQGYRLAATPSFSYLDGTYVQRITELKIADYEILFDKEAHKSKDHIITRYLPKSGTVLNETSLNRGLLNAVRLGAFEVTGINPVAAENPDEVIVQIGVRELPTGLFQPGLNYETSATSNQFFANFTFSDTNFLGEAHNISTEVKAQTSDVGFMLGGNVSYTIPWLYIDQLDFKEVPTRLSASLFSDVVTNQVMSAGGSIKICLDPVARVDDSCKDEERVQVGEYTKRETGVAFGIGRQVLPFTQLGVSARGGFSEYKLEPGEACKVDDEGKITNFKTCDLSKAEALQYLPQSGLSALVSSSIEYDDRDDPNFPHEGVFANAKIGVGFGSDYRNAANEQQNYLYSPVEFGVRTYLELAKLFPDVQDKNHVLAFKVTVGHQFGANYPTNRYFIVGDSFVNDTLIRGYRRDQVDPSQSYAIGTLEYRYDFNLSTVATRTIIALAYADIGWASSVPGFDNYSTPLLAGGGVGVQINLGLGGFLFPAIRMDYSFSHKSPTGVFRFRLGPVF